MRDRLLVPRAVCSASATTKQRKNRTFSNCCMVANAAKYSQKRNTDMLGGRGVERDVCSGKVLGWQQASLLLRRFGRPAIRLRHGRYFGSNLVYQRRVWAHPIPRRSGSRLAPAWSRGRGGKRRTALR